jgi:hypothetical protein
MTKNYIYFKIYYKEFCYIPVCVDMIAFFEFISKEYPDALLFIVKYQDLEGNHIRLRILFSDSYKLQDLNSIKVTYLNFLRQNQPNIVKISTGCIYEPELDRYGGLFGINLMHEIAKRSTADFISFIDSYIVDDSNKISLCIRYFITIIKRSKKLSDNDNYKSIFRDLYLEWLHFLHYKDIHYCSKVLNVNHKEVINFYNSKLDSCLLDNLNMSYDQFHDDISKTSTLVSCKGFVSDNIHMISNRFGLSNLEEIFVYYIIFNLNLRR